MKHLLFPSLALSLLLSTVASAKIIRLDQPVNASIPEELILHWAFNEDSGVEAHNSAGTGMDYNGFLFAGGFDTPEFVPGVNATFGNAVRLRGGDKQDMEKDANPHVQWKGEATLTELDLISEPFTAGLWVAFDQPIESGQTVRLLARGRYRAGNFWDISLRSVQSNNAWKTVLTFTMGAEGEDQKYLQGNLTVGKNHWHHFAVTFEPLEDGEARVILYFDGNKIAEGKLPYRGFSLTAQDRVLTVGERAVSLFQSRFDGRIDDVFIARGIHGFSNLPD